MKFKEYFSKFMDSNIKHNKDTWIYTLLFTVVFAGLFGWIYEFFFYFANSGFTTFYMRGGNFLPWINIYAYGALIIITLTYKLRKKPILVFLVAALSCGILEYFSGLAMYKLMNGIRCWDYTKEILSGPNLDGFVCLRSVIVFGFSALMLMYLVLPLTMYVLETSKHLNVLKKVIVVLFSIVLFDELYNLIFADLFKLPEAYDIYKSIGIKYMDYYN